MLCKMLCISGYKSHGIQENTSDSCMWQYNDIRNFVSLSWIDNYITIIDAIISHIITAFCLKRVMVISITNDRKMKARNEDICGR